MSHGAEGVQYDGQTEDTEGVMLTRLPPVSTIDVHLDKNLGVTLTKPLQTGTTGSE